MYGMELGVTLDMASDISPHMIFNLAPVFLCHPEVQPRIS